MTPGHMDLRRAATTGSRAPRATAAMMPLVTWNVCSPCPLWAFKYRQFLAIVQPPEQRVILSSLALETSEGQEGALSAGANVTHHMIGPRDRESLCMKLLPAVSVSQVQGTLSSLWAGLRDPPVPGASHHALFMSVRWLSDPRQKLARSRRAEWGFRKESGGASSIENRYPTSGQRMVLLEAAVLTSF